MRRARPLADSDIIGTRCNEFVVGDWAAFGAGVIGSRGSGGEDGGRGRSKVGGVREPEQKGGGQKEEGAAGGGGEEEEEVVAKESFE